MYDDEIVKISRLQNGYEVSIYDPSPSLEKATKKAMESGTGIGLFGGWRSYAFDNEPELLAFLGEKLPSLNPRNFEEADQAAFDAGVESEMPTKKGR